VINHRHPPGKLLCEDLVAATGAKAPDPGRLFDEPHERMTIACITELIYSSGE